MNIEVFITHFVAKDHPWAIGYNEILLNQIEWIQRVTKPEYRLTVVYYFGDEAVKDHFLAFVPTWVRAIKNDRSYRPDTQPSMRNKVVSLAKESPANLAILLHNDVRPAQGWLEALIHDMKRIDKATGDSRLGLVSPRYIPYHLTGHEKLTYCKPFWKMMNSAPHVKKLHEMDEWCKPWKFQFSNETVICPSWQPPVENGHIIMMWAAHPEFFDFGECDERFDGLNYDDCDWGIRALIACKRTYQSQTALMGHVESLTFGGFGQEGHQREPASNNEEVFVKKWGRPLFDEMQSGAIWHRLRRAR